MDANQMTFIYQSRKIQGLNRVRQTFHAWKPDFAAVIDMSGKTFPHPKSRWNIVSPKVGINESFGANS